MICSVVVEVDKVVFRDCWYSGYNMVEADMADADADADGGGIAVIEKVKIDIDHKALVGHYTPIRLDRSGRMMDRESERGYRSDLYRSMWMVRRRGP